MILIDGKTLEEWNTEIDGYTIVNVWEEVFSVIYANMLFDNKNREEREPSEYYQRIDVFQMVGDEKVFATKLPFSDYLTAELDYKTQLKSDFAARFADLELAQQVQDVLDSIPELIIAMRELSIADVNPSIYASTVVASRDLDQANALLSAYNAWRSAQDVIDAEDQAINDGVSLIEKGKKVVAYINFLNRQKNLTVEQFQQILADQDLQLIERLCLNGSLVSARFQISQYVPDGVIMLQEDKDKILAYMDR